MCSRTSYSQDVELIINLRLLKRLLLLTKLRLRLRQKLKKKRRRKFKKKRNPVRICPWEVCLTDLIVGYYYLKLRGLGFGVWGLGFG